MRAARFHTDTRVLAVEEVSLPAPRPHEVRVKVGACGICLSDVHLIDGSLPTALAVVTPGHEAAGVVEALGAEVAGWKEGDRVVLAGGRPCGTCANCVRGRAEECLAFEIMGFGFDGAWAEYVVVPAAALSAVPDDLPIEQAAILADAVATPYAGLTERAQLKAGESVGLWGIGGLGVHAVQIARMVGATPIIAVDPNPLARQRALERGADLALDPGDADVVGEVRSFTGGHGLDLAVDLYGSNAVLAQAAACLGHRGRVLMVGLSMEPIALGPGAFFGVSSQSLLGHLGYHKRHLDQLVDLVTHGRLDVSGSITETLVLDDVARGVEHLATKAGNPIRLVVRPNG